MAWNVAFWRKPSRDADCWPAETDGLYQLWVTCPKQVARNLPPSLAFTPAEVDVAAVWSARHKDCGLRAAVANAACVNTNVLEVFGPDDAVPHCIMYPTQSGIQVDEFTGDCKLYSCLEAALQEIAPVQ